MVQWWWFGEDGKAGVVLVVKRGVDPVFIKKGALGLTWWAGKRLGPSGLGM